MGQLCRLCRLGPTTPQRPTGGARFTLPAPLSKSFPNEFPYTKTRLLEPIHRAATDSPTDNGLYLV
jgi:hypothetical protein